MDPYTLLHPPTPPSRFFEMLVLVRENGWTDGTIDGRMDGWTRLKWLSPQRTKRSTPNLPDEPGLWPFLFPAPHAAIPSVLRVRLRQQHSV